MGGGSAGKRPYVKLPGALLSLFVDDPFPVLAELHVTVAIQNNVNTMHPGKPSCFLSCRLYCGLGS